MARNVVFYECGVCGNLVGLIREGGGELVCCGQPMKKLEPNTVDASQEKHVPVSERKDGKIYAQVGSVVHPMTEAHYIQWIAVVSDRSIEIKYLKPGEEPKAVFSDVEGDAEVYEYCNLHGLWKAPVR